MVLKCDVRKDIRYSRPNPKFHHWHLGDKRFGLTFERLADAREFDRGVKNAVADLTDGEYWHQLVSRKPVSVLLPSFALYYYMTRSMHK